MPLLYWLSHSSRRQENLRASIARHRNLGAGTGRTENPGVREWHAAFRAAAALAGPQRRTRIRTPGDELRLNLRRLYPLDARPDNRSKENR